MKGPIMKTVSVPRPQNMELRGAPIDVGAQLAAAVLQPSLLATLDAVQPKDHEGLLAGVLAELAGHMRVRLGKARAAALFTQFAEISLRIPADQLDAAPDEPEVH